MMYRRLVGCVLFAILAISSSSSAEWLKVDISPQSSSVNVAPGFTNWVVLGGTGVGSVSQTFGGVTVDVNQASPTADATHYLKGGWANKQGQSAFQLPFDGVWAHWKDDSLSADIPYPLGGALTMTITGLSTGTHNIVTYHNDPWPDNYNNGNTPKVWTADGQTYNNIVSKCMIYVNGVYVKTITPTTDARSNAACGYAFFSVDAVAGQPVVIGLVPDHSGELDAVFLNGFEIDAPAEPSAYATVPYPANGDLHANANNDDPGPGQAGIGYLTLSWAPSAFAASHNVYFGTSEAEVTSATTSTSGIYKGNQTATTYPVSGLSSRTTYYWRVDEVDSTSAVTKGATWSFVPRRVAFPGAEGWGRFSRGGRGGKVLHVTNLNSSGPGSFKAAIDDTGPRTIVFDVSGIIPLTGSLQLKNNFCTVAGQTAPGKGICFRDYDFGPYGGSDFIIRYVRVRVGKEIGTDKTLGGMGAASSTEVIFDHCSISWSIDEAFSSRQAGNLTLQRCLISEALCFVWG